MENELALEKENFKMEFSENNFEVNQYFKKLKYQPSDDILESMRANF